MISGYSWYGLHRSSVYSVFSLHRISSYSGYDSEPINMCSYSIMMAGLVERWLMHMRSPWFISTYLESNIRHSANYYIIKAISSYYQIVVSETRRTIAVTWNNRISKYLNPTLEISWNTPRPTIIYKYTQQQYISGTIK
jgi:hypothetical protein